jgi:hemerythrin superfamily protein
MSILDLLKQDHKEVSELLSEMSETTDRAAKKRQQLFSECKTALMAHSHAELQAFYKPLMKDGDDEDALLEAQVEHEVVERLLEDISATEPTDEKWLAKITVLKELVEHHVEEEESEIFKLARKAYDKKQLDEIGARFEELKQQEMAQTPA